MWSRSVLASRSLLPYPPGLQTKLGNCRINRTTYFEFGASVDRSIQKKAHAVACRGRCVLNRTNPSVIGIILLAFMHIIACIL